MKHLKIMKKKEVKQMMQWLQKRFQLSKEADDLFYNHVFLLSPKQKIYVVTKEAFQLPLDELRVDTLGMYFATKEDDGYRLSIEGSQFLGPLAQANILTFDDRQMKQWMQGMDLARSSFEAYPLGYYLVQWNHDFLGCAKIVENKILNYVPKPRRIVLA